MHLSDVHEVSDAEFASFLEAWKKLDSPTTLPSKEEFLAPRQPYKINSFTAACKVGSALILRHLLSDSARKAEIVRNVGSWSGPLFTICKLEDDDKCIQCLDVLKQHDVFSCSTLTSAIVKRSRQCCFEWLVKHVSMSVIESYCKEWSAEFTLFLHQQRKLDLESIAKQFGRQTVLSIQKVIFPTIRDDFKLKFEDVKMNAIISIWSPDVMYDLIRRNRSDALEFYLECHTSRATIDMSKVAVDGHCPSLAVWKVLHVYFKLDDHDILREDAGVLKQVLSAKNMVSYTVAEWMVDSFDIRSKVNVNQLLEWAKTQPYQSCINFVTFNFASPHVVKLLRTASYPGLCEYEEDTDQLRYRLFLQALQQKDTESAKWLYTSGSLTASNILYAATICAENSYIKGLKLMFNDLVTKPSHEKWINDIIQHAGSVDVLDWLRKHVDVKKSDIEKVPRQYVQWFADEDLLDKEVFISTSLDLNTLDICSQIGVTKEDLAPHLTLFYHYRRFQLILTLHEKYIFDSSDIVPLIRLANNDPEADFFVYDIIGHSAIMLHEIYDPHCHHDIRMKMYQIYGHEQYAKFELDVHETLNPDDSVASILSAIKLGNVPVAKWILGYHCVAADSEVWDNDDIKDAVNKLNDSYFKGWIKNYLRKPEAMTLDDFVTKFKDGDLKIKPGVDLTSFLKKMLSEPSTVTAEDFRDYFE